jgi:hypothetical protein
MLIGTPCFDAPLVGFSWRAEGTALRTTTEYDWVEPEGSGVARAWSHSTPPALSLASARTESSKVGPVLDADSSILVQTSGKSSAS